MKHEDWINKLSAQNDKSTRTYVEEHRDKIDKVRLKFLDEIKAGRIPQTMHGAFGPETTSSDAYVEEIVTPKEGGHYYKLYGCSYLYKGYYEDHTVHGIQMAKSIVSEIPAQMMKMPLIALGFGATFLFRRKKLLKFIDDTLQRIDYRVMRWYDIPAEYYNEASKELFRATVAGIQGVSNLWGAIAFRFMRFFVLVLETDNAYRLRVQDAVYEAIKRGKRSIFGVLEVLIERETKQGIAHKWRFIKIVLRVALFLSPTLRGIIKRTMQEINPIKIKMDEADWYFSLKFKSYSFQGRTEEERLKERDRLDELHGHIYLL